MPALNRLNQSMQNSGLQIHAIALDGDRQSSIEKFKNRYSLDLTILLDVETGISKAFSVSVLPVSYLVNDNGDIVGRFIGMRNWDADYFREFLLRQMASN
jgi:peroxiredoxin